MRCKKKIVTRSFTLSLDVLFLKMHWFVRCYDMIYFDKECQGVLVLMIITL